MLGTADFELKVERAKQNAARLQKPLFVVELDNDGDGRSLSVVDERYVNSDEFTAFDGFVVATVSPDGSVEL